MNDAWATILALADDRDSGAGEIARRAAGGLTNLPTDRVREGLETLLRGHPPMAPLWRLGSETLGGSHGVREAVHRFMRILDRDAAASEVMADSLPSRIVTISWSSAVVDALRHRRPERLVCLASEPGGEGARTAEALRDAAGSVEVWDDQDAIDRVPGDAVVTGADALTPNGVVNKVGTAALAEAAHRKGIPCYAIGGETKLMAEEPPLQGPFESTPPDLFSGVAMPDGVLSADRIRHLARSRPIHPELTELLEALGSRPFDQPGD